MTLKEVTHTLETLFEPLSIFLYGSMVRGDTNSQSDYEVGIIFNDNDYISRRELSKAVNSSMYRIYPFRLSEITNSSIDTPFQKNIFIRSLVSGNAKTLSGEAIIENLKKPVIRGTDIYEELSFNLGYAFSAMHTYRDGNLELTKSFLYKSCLYATRAYCMVIKKEICLGYGNVCDLSKTVSLPKEFEELIKFAYDLRCEKDIEFNDMYIYKNLTYINKYIFSELDKIITDKNAIILE